jgi:hypothetical protein
MIAQGTDGLSRGVKSTGVMQRVSMESFVPLHQSMLQRCVTALFFALGSWQGPRVWNLFSLRRTTGSQRGKSSAPFFGTLPPPCRCCHRTIGKSTTQMTNQFAYKCASPNLRIFGLFFQKPTHPFLFYSLFDIASIDNPNDIK